MNHREPNHRRIRPSVCFTLPSDQVDYLGGIADRTGRPRSSVLEDVIAFFMGIDQNRIADGDLFIRVTGSRQEGEAM